jgi:hypothetical protein
MKPPERTAGVPHALAEVVDDLRQGFLVEPSEPLARRQLDAMLEAAATALGSPSSDEAAPPVALRPRRRVRAAIAAAGVGVMVATGGVAAAATGSLPGPVQDFVASLVEPIGIDIPRAEDPDDAPVPADPPGDLGEDGSRGSSTTSLAPIPGAGPSSTGAPPDSAEEPGGPGAAPHGTDDPSGQSKAPGRDGDPGRSGEAPGQNKEAPGQNKEGGGPPDSTPGNPDPGPPDDKSKQDKGDDGPAAGGQPGPAKAEPEPEDGTIIDSSRGPRSLS